jgi:hypothetical protein
MFGEISSDTYSSSVTVNNSGTGTVYIAHNGDLTVNGDLTINNNGTGTNSLVYLADGATSTCIIDGSTTINSAGGTSNSRIYLGNNGDVTFNGPLSINISTGAANSQVYLNTSSTSSNTYNENIVVTNSNVGGDGVYFGISGGTGVLAAGKTITIGGGGFVAGQLYLRNFTQTGATAQSITLTGTAQFFSYDSNWGGALTVTSPQIEIRGTTVSGITTLTKTGVGSDYCYGGNTFSSNCSITNNGSGILRFGETDPDIFSGNLTIVNSGSGTFQFAHGSLGNTIAGNLNVTNSCATGNTNILICNDSASTLTVSGTANFTNSSGDIGYIYIGQNGDITFNDNVNITNSATGATGNIHISNQQYSEVTTNGNLTINSTGSATNINSYVSNNGTLTINGNFTANNNNSATNSEFNIANSSTSSIIISGNATLFNNGVGTTKNLFFGDDGDVTVNGTTSLTNSSSANNTQILVNYGSTSSGTFLDNITIEATSAENDEISFGNNGGSSTLAATKTVTIGGGGFVEGNLTFRNFTQVGNTPQSLTISGTGILENYDANWGGNVSFAAPRIRTRGTTYQGTSSFTKNGSGDDRSAGGNNFVGNAIFSVLGDNRLALGDGSPDIFGGNLTYNNTSDGGDFELAYNSAGNTIAGNFILNHTPTNGSATILISRSSTSTLSITGTTTLNNGGTPADSPIYFGYDGNITFGDDLSINNTITSGTSNVYLAQRSASALVINGNLSCTNSGSGTTERVYIGDDGDLTLNGTLTLSNNSSSTTSEFYAADGSTSDVTIANDVTAVNNGSGTTSRFYLGNSGNVTFNGNISLSNTSGATNSEMRLNYNATSTNACNGNIVVENTNANGDGIRFGENGGTGVLAAAQTLTIGAGGFNSGDLEFRNFTRTGATTTTLTCTGTARIYSYDTFWNGDVNFTAPRIVTLGTTYSGVTTLEKTGASDDVSAGGNTFADDLTATNSGSNYFMFGNGTSDTYSANVT